MGPAAGDARAIARSAAGIYAGAMLIGAIEEAIPGGPQSSLLPAIAALVLAPLVAILGPRMPRNVLALLGPIGAALIAYALQSTHDWTDGAVMYMWPVLWMSHFYGRRGTVFIVAWVGVVHGLALAAMPAGDGERRPLGRRHGLRRGRRRRGARAVGAQRDRLVARLAAEARVGPAHRAAQPPRLRGAPRASSSRARPASSTSLALVASTSTTSSASTTSTATRPATACSRWLGAVIAEHVRGADLAARLGRRGVRRRAARARSPGACAFAERVRAAVAAPGTGADRERRRRGRGHPRRTRPRSSPPRTPRCTRPSARGATAPSSRTAARSRRRDPAPGYSPGGWRTT